MSSEPGQLQREWLCAVGRWLLRRCNRLYRWALDTPDSLRTYVKLLRGKWLASLPALGTAVLAVINAFRGPHHQLGLSARDWLGLTAVGVILAQYAVWRDTFRGPVDPDHKAFLQGVAGGLLAAAEGAPRRYGYEGVFGTVPQEMFDAHFPEIDGLLTARAERAAAQETALTDLGAAISESTSKNWPSDDGWNTGSIAGLAFRHVSQSPALPPVDLLYTDEGAALMWAAQPLSVVRDITDDDKQRFIDWVQDLRECDEFVAWEAAMAATDGAQEKAIVALNRIITDQGIKRTRGCAVCVPSR